LLSVLHFRVGPMPVLFLLVLVGSFDFTYPPIYFFSLILAADFQIPNTLLCTGVLVLQGRLSIFLHIHLNNVP